MSPFWIAVISAIQEFFSSPTVQSLGSTFMGVFLGIPAGYILNHRWERRTDKIRTIELLAAIRQSLDHNMHLIGELERHIGTLEQLATFNVDFFLLDSIAGLKYELLEVQLCQDLDRVRFELVHLGREVDMLLNLCFNPMALIPISETKESPFEHLSSTLRRIILQHIGTVRATLTEVQGKLPVDP
jgi:hypothetical protein